MNLQTQNKEKMIKIFCYNTYFPAMPGWIT